MSIATENQKTSLPIADVKTFDAGIDYELFLDCVHCGLCTSACPTYVELGDENDSPRGRIYLMRAVTDGRLDLTSEVQRHLNLCLDCRACETACPSGVQYGQLIEPFRIHMEETIQPEKKLGLLTRFLLFHVTPYANRTRWALAPAKIMQWTGLDWLVQKSGVLNLFPRFFRNLHDMLPKLKGSPEKLPEVLPAEGKKRAKVALFTGCAGDAFFPRTTWTTAKVLQKNGCEVWIPKNQVCCGALHYHSARPEPARKFGRENLEVFSSQELDAIIVNAAGCGAMLKEYNHLFPEEGAVSEFMGKIKDISEFLVELGPVPPTHPLPLKATYHDACHLCHGQQIRQQPRTLLEMIPKLELAPLAESEICCGAAGSYNLTEPEMAERLGLRKAQNILDTQAEAVFTGNVGCVLQIARYLKKQRPGMWVSHPVDALWASYSGDYPPEIRSKIES